MPDPSKSLSIDPALFPPDVRAYIDESLATGRYSSEEELIHAALYAMKAELEKNAVQQVDAK